MSRLLQLLTRALVRRVRVGGLLRLGTPDGGWWFMDLPARRSGLVISAGAGDDISFDIAIARRFAATVVIVDPTPRAVSHVRGVIGRLGRPAETSFVPGGRQPLQAYDTSDVLPDQVQLVEAALWRDDAGLALYPPLDPSHVSHSATDFQRRGARSSPPLHVDSVSLADLVREGRNCELLKLDIEGAEYEVIASLAGSPLRPRQLLVEFDEVAVPSVRHLLRFTASMLRLRRLRYRLVHTEGRNFTFVHRSADPSVVARTRSRP